MHVIDIRRFFLQYRKILSAAGMLLIVAVIFWTVNSPAIVGAAATQRQLPVYSVQRDDKVVALSFDAAWGNEDTQTLIDILSKYHVNTTFFVVGDWVDRYPDSVRALAEAGNEVMNHSSSHAHFSSLSRDQIIADITACNEKIAAVTGQTPTLFRCPYGEYDDHVISTIRGMGMTPVQWSIDSLDWKGLSAGEIQHRVLKDIEPGSIILFHNAAENTPEALPGILESLIAEGYRIVPISQILLDGDTMIDSTGKQCPKR